MARRTATGPNGEKLVLEGGKWVPLDTPAGFTGPIDEMTGPLPSLGRNPQEQIGNLRQGLRSAGGSFISNLLSTPHATGELLAAGAAVPQTLGGAAMAAIRGQPMNLGERFSAARAEQESSFPASALLKLPDPTAEDVLAVPGAIARSYSNTNANAQRAMALGRDPNAQVGPVKSPQLGAAFDESLALERQRSEASPIATGAGRVAGDVATLLALRPGERMTKALGLSPRAAAPGDVGALNEAARLLARGLGRTAEAGFEGAVIAAVGDGDPVKTAAYSAGIQAGGSAALTAKNAMLRNPVKTFAALWLGHQMWKAISPGPQQAFESSDAAIKELIAAYGLGTAAAMVGAGRGVGEGAVRQVTDAISTASRGTVASVITQLQEADRSGNNIPSKVLEMMGEDPNRFGSEVRERLERAASSEKPQALVNEINALIGSNERFRQAVEPQSGARPQSMGEWIRYRTGGGF